MLNIKGPLYIGNLKDDATLVDLDNKFSELDKETREKLSNLDKQAKEITDNRNSEFERLSNLAVERSIELGWMPEGFSKEKHELHITHNGQIVIDNIECDHGNPFERFAEMMAKRSAREDGVAVDTSGMDLQ